jgi:hypothetical protein
MKPPQGIRAALAHDAPIPVVATLRWLMLHPRQRRKYRTRAKMEALVRRFIQDGLKVTIQHGQRMFRLSDWAKFRAEKWPEATKPQAPSVSAGGVATATALVTQTTTGDAQ